MVHESGALCLEGEYVAGEREGWWHSFDAEGRPLESRRYHLGIECEVK